MTDHRLVAYRWRFEDKRAWNYCRGRPAWADDSDIVCEALYIAPTCGAKAYVERAIASYAGDPADNQFQKGFLAALEVVRDEAFT